MLNTPASLLERLRTPEERASWERFVTLYTPLIHGWARGAGASADDAAEVVQDVLITLVRKLPEFRYDADRSFRAWLKTITLNAWRARFRSPSVPIDARVSEGLENVAAPESDDAEEAEYRRYLAERTLELIRVEFQATTWQAAWETLVRGRAPAEVAESLGMSRNAVYIAKLRVLRRVHQELNGLID